MKAKAKTALSKTVDQILWELWDPIGLNRNAAARNEYSNYVGSVVRLLINGADAFKLAQHLYSLEHSSICATDAQRRNHVAKALLRAYSEYA